ncbi:hypothetical protein CISG_01557 [Coccidioides immitis RMSCC 3703]|uniref:Uncharacterized protein n=2 Tax=Coccidioides immitis TaxID=5501 RepID=A0A0J8QZ89_COCIT|nr:hypothetical protein CIRG_04951 [Coccidioides immitis RMSCC 2394]KMU77801.1 hypothetical protein CISG_01557 [Coccidioides immitis RMSCC 3703]
MSEDGRDLCISVLKTDFSRPLYQQRNRYRSDVLTILNPAMKWGRFGVALLGAGLKAKAGDENLFTEYGAAPAPMLIVNKARYAWHLLEHKYIYSLIAIVTFALRIREDCTISDYPDETIGHGWKRRHVLDIHPNFLPTDRSPVDIGNSVSHRLTHLYTSLATSIELVRWRFVCVVPSRPQHALGVLQILLA